MPSGVQPVRGSDGEEAGAFFVGHQFGESEGLNNGYVAYFIKKQCSAIGQFKLALTGFYG